MSALYYRPHLHETPDVLPFEAVTVEDGAFRTDLANQPESIAECGFKLAPARPDDTETQVVTWDADAENWAFIDRPPVETPPVVPPEPVILGKGEFYDLVRSNGVSFAQIKSASDDPALAEFWFALNNFYSQIRRDHPSTRQGLAAMVALGHIDQAAADHVFASWPVQ